MLTREDNELLTRVGPGTPMGDLLRQYWMPLLFSEELPEADCPPKRVRLLGEDLIAYRDTSNRVGLLANACPHRGASMFFGRNEEDGLRCVYHGWKFDVTGACTDMPNEPAESNFKHKIRIAAYECRERNGLLWAYMGPQSPPPPLPDLEFNMQPDNLPFMWRSLRACNWMQAMEGDIDTSHVNFLHLNLDKTDTTTVPGQAMPGMRGAFRSLLWADASPKLEVVDTDYGCVYTAKRDQGDGTEYHRIHPFIFPFHTMIGGSIDEKNIVTSYNGKAWVPMDDDNTLILEWQLRPSQPWSAEEKAQLLRVRNPWGYLPDDNQPAGAWKLAGNATNNYHLDYELQRTKLFFGVLSNPLQDGAVQESMGPIYDRPKEHLGTADAMIIRVRRRLLEAAKALRDRGATPPCVDDPALYRLRPVGAILPKGTDWIAETAERRRAFRSPMVG